MSQVQGQLLTVSQAATEIGITRQAVQQLIESGTLNAEWVLERWGISATEVKRYKREKAAKSPKISNGNGNK